MKDKSLELAMIPPHILGAIETLIKRGLPPWVSTAALRGPRLRPLDIANFDGDFVARTGDASEGAQATYSGRIFTIWLPRPDVSAILPNGFELAARKYGGQNHPVICMLGLQADCKLLRGGVACPAAQAPYQELILLIPFVVHTGGTLWHNFSARMYLDALFPIVIGDVVFQYSKTVGDFESTTGVLPGSSPGSFPATNDQVTDLISGSIVYADFSQQTAAWVPAAAGPSGFEDFEKVMEMPILGVEFPQTTPAPMPPACSYFEWDFSSAEVASMHGAVQFIDPFRPGMAGWVHQPPDWLTADEDASFMVRNVRWRLSEVTVKCSF